MPESINCGKCFQVERHPGDEIRALLQGCLTLSPLNSSTHHKSSSAAFMDHKVKGDERAGTLETVRCQSIKFRLSDLL